MGFLGSQHRVGRSRDAVASEEHDEEGKRWISNDCWHARSSIPRSLSSNTDSPMIPPTQSWPRARLEVEHLLAAGIELFGRRDAIRQEQKRLEDESASVAAKIAKDTATLYGGKVTAPKELESLQSEMALLKQRLDDFDDAVLEQMERAEPLDAEGEALASSTAAAASMVEQRENEVTVMQAEVGTALDAARVERAGVAATDRRGLDDALRGGTTIGWWSRSGATGGRWDLSGLSHHAARARSTPR